MKFSALHNQSGSALLESLVSLVVVAVGVLGIAKMNMVMLASTGVAKTRAEAMQLAQEKFDEFRNVTTSAQYAALANGNDSPTGTNATFRRTWMVNGASDPSDARVCVAWPGSVADACTATNDRIILSGIISWNNPGVVGNVSAPTPSMGGFIRTPTGRATVGGTHTYDPASIPGTANTVTLDGGTTTNDGTKTYVVDGVRELIGSNGKVLLSAGKLSCEANPPEFSTIEGKLFIGAKNGSPIASFSNTRVLSSDASYCAVLTPDASWKLPAGCSGNACRYFYTYYKCYIGAFWWGNIGIQRIDNANTNDKVCLGNPLDTGPATLFNRSSADVTNMNTSHAYRGYADLGGGTYETRGIGEQTTRDAACTAISNRDVFNYIPTHYKNHHFVHDNLTGSQSCTTTETALNNTVAAAPLPLNTTAALGALPTVTRYDSIGNTITDPSLYGTAVKIDSTAANNPGRYYCMSHDDGGYSGTNCPNLSSATPTNNTVIHGTITKHGGATLTGIDTTYTACKTGTTSLTDNGNGTYSYSCSLNWTGFAGSGWYGAITFTAGGTSSLCAAGATIAVVPSGNTVAFSVNDANAATHPNSLYFTDVPLAVTDVTINFSVYALPCGLGAPSPSWATTGNNPRPLLWDAITGATGYRVYVRTGCANVASCAVDTTGTGTYQTATSHDLGSVSNNTTSCVAVKATDGTVDSPASSPKCLSRSGGTYTPN